MARGEKVKLEKLKKYTEELDKCTECGYCTFWRPVYQEDPR